MRTCGFVSGYGKCIRAGEARGRAARLPVRSGLAAAGRDQNGQAGDLGTDPVSLEGLHLRDGEYVLLVGL